jgi:hypothetical protein
MPRYSVYGRSDTPDTPNGDDRFIGIDMTRKRQLLGPGMLALGQNTRLDSGTVYQRNGTIIPTDYNPTGGFTNALVGSGVYSDPDSKEIMVIAPANSQYIYAVGDGIDFYRIPIDPTGVGTTGVVNTEFVQAFDRLLALRLAVAGGLRLAWDGTGDVNHDGLSDSNFLPMTLSSVGLKLIEGNVLAGEPIGNRIAYYYPDTTLPQFRDTWLISDINDYTSYDDIFQSFRTNSGEADYITALRSYFNTSLIVYKSQSIHQVTLLPTFPLTVQTRQVSKQLGSCSRFLPISIGGDQIFLNEPNGFYRLSEVDEQNTQTLPLPISEPIQRVIDQINWRVTRLTACSAQLGRYAFFGIAVGPNSSQPNTVLVYDTQTRQWVSAGDTWADPSFGFRRLHVTNYGGIKRIFAVDYIQGIVYLLYEGVDDQLAGGTFAVPFKLETRGYTNPQAPFNFQRFKRSEFIMSTYNPKIKVTAVTDGFNEEKVIGNISKNRNRYYVQKADYIGDGPGGNDPYREDYSVIGSEQGAIEDFEDLPVGQIRLIPGTSPDTTPGIKQQTIEPLAVNVNGRWVSFRVENAQGQVDIEGAGVEGFVKANNFRRKA